MNKEGTVYTILFVFLVSFVFVFFLSMTNELTVEEVRSNQEVARQRAVLSAMGVSTAGVDEVRRAYGGVSGDPEAGLYAAMVGGQVVYALQFRGAGLWGQISGVVAVSSDFQRIVGLEIVEDNETPGLGGRINEAAFKEQFRDVRVGDGLLSVGGAGAQVDAITGATRTSEAIEAILNEQLQVMRSEQVRTRLRDLAAEGGNV